MYSIYISILLCIYTVNFPNTESILAKIESFEVSLRSMFSNKIIPRRPYMYTCKACCICTKEKKKAALISREKGMKRAEKKIMNVMGGEYARMHISERTNKRRSSAVFVIWLFSYTSFFFLRFISSSLFSLIILIGCIHSFLFSSQQRISAAKGRPRRLAAATDDERRRAGTFSPRAQHNRLYMRIGVYVYRQSLF